MLRAPGRLLDGRIANDAIGNQLWSAASQAGWRLRDGPESRAE